MKHPNPDVQKKQDEFLANCPDDDKEYHATAFRVGNALYTYHNQVRSVKPEELKTYYEEWLQGLPENISADMRKKGIEYCTTVLSFTRYIMERKDYGLRDWMKEHLSEEDYNYYQNAEEAAKKKL